MNANLPPWGRRLRARAVVAAALVLVTSGTVWAVVYPNRRFGPEHGLVTGNAAAVLQDSRGLVWLATDEGVARLEGTTFRMLGEEAGLTSLAVTDIVEVPDGSLWFSTTGGVCRLSPSGLDDEAAFSCGATDTSVEGLSLSHDGRTLWATTTAGLFEIPLEQSPPVLVPIEFPLADGCEPRRSRPQADRSGGVWIGTSCGVARLRPDRLVDEWRVGGAHAELVRGWPLHADAGGTIWFELEGEPSALYGFRPDPGVPATVRRWQADDIPNRGPHLPDDGESVRVTLPAPLVRGPTAHATSRLGGEEIWVGTTRGVARVRDGSIEMIGSDAQLRRGALWVLGVGLDGAIWTAGSGGVHAIQPRGFVTYEDHEGPGPQVVSDLFEDAEGVWAVSMVEPDRWRVHLMSGDGTISVEVGLPASASRTWWGFNHKALRDRHGGWWFATPGGLVHHPPTDRLEALADAGRATLLTNDRLDAPGGVWSVFEDSRGNLWISAWPSKLFVWEPGSPKPRELQEFAALDLGAACSYAEDNDGAIWIGSYEGSVIRWRDGILSVVTVDLPDTPRRMITDLYVDHAGTILIAHPWAGLLAISDPAALHPRARASAGPDLPRVRSIVEDEEHSLWLGTKRGVFRFRPDDGSLRQYAWHDGLPAMWTNSLLVGDGDVLWVGTAMGLSRFAGETTAEQLDRPPSFLKAVIDGQGFAVPWVGTRALKLPRLAAGLHQLELTMSEESTLDGALQYQIQGADVGAGDSWSAPSRGATLRLAGLGQGSYRIAVRSANPDGSRASEAASVELDVAPAWWRTPWASGLIVALALGIAITVYQIRLARYAQRERIRKRIAGDLHDELGTSLARISILSGVVAAARSREEIGPLVQAIGETARNAVDANSDMIWAIDPRRDLVSELVRRLRAFAGGFVEGAGAQLDFQVSIPDGELPLGADVRRNVYLSMKEAIANAVKHAGANLVRVSLALEDGALTAVVEDDGIGFELDKSSGPSTGAVPAGYGLHSIERRVHEAGGTLLIVTRVGSGTCVKIRVPLGGKTRTLFKRK